MLKTSCEIHGVKYILKYKKILSEKGELYIGILF